MVFILKIMTFITRTALLCTTISAVTIQVLSISSGTKKGSKKSVTIGPIDTTANLLRPTPVKQQKSSGVKRPTISKCKNDFKIHEFVLFPLKSIFPVTGVYIVRNKNTTNTTRKTQISRATKCSKSTKKLSSISEDIKTTIRFPVSVKSKTSKNLKIKLKTLKAVKNPSTKRSIKKRIRKSKNIKTVKIKPSFQCDHLPTSKTPRSTIVPGKTLPLLSVNENKMVLSPDQFVFRPAIPINENNYPLDNTDKNELYDQDATVDKVLSYGFTDPATNNYIKFPSVSKIIEETISEKSKLILANWRQKMIDGLGEEGFFNHSEALKRRGTEFHMAVRNAVLGTTTENCSEVTRNSLKSLSWMLKHISNPLAVESTIAHPKLGYRGVADCIAMFRNIPVIIDWKLSDKPKRYLKDTYDAPVQITAYIGALNHDPNYKWGVNHGLVAVAYSNGDPCDVFLLAPKHCQIYWRHWLMRFNKFKARSHLHLDHNIDEKSLELI